MKLYVVRHGETNFNKNQIVQGVTDEPLSDTGREQAARTREEFREMGVHFDRVYTSPLQRAAETAEIISGCAQDEIIMEDRMIEMNFGVYEGMHITEAIEDLRPMFRDPLGYKGLESVDPVQKL